MPRFSIPCFSFTKARRVGESLNDVEELTRRLIADGHFHFRIKSTSAEVGLAKREDIDSWVMLRIMQTILSTGGAPIKNIELIRALHKFTGGGPQGFDAYPDADQFFTGERRFALTDIEAPALYG